MLPCVYNSLIYNSQKLETAQMFINERIDTNRMWYIYSEILLIY